MDAALARQAWLAVVFNPEPAMQTFMCLTGFLSAISLVPALEKTPNHIRSVLRYYKKRLLRIAPAYFMMLMVIRMLGAVLGESESLPPHVRRTFFEPLRTFDKAACKDTIAHNIFFVHNQQPGGGCYTTTWSLAVQMQFWCMFPLALLLLRPQMPGFRARVAWSLLATIGAVLAYRAWQVNKVQLWTKMPLRLYSPDLPTALTIRFLGHHSYFSTLARLAPLCFGCLAALCVMHPSCKQKMARHSSWLHVLWACLALSNFAGCFVNKVGPHSDPTHLLANPINCAFAYVVITGVLSPLLPALTLLLITSKGVGTPSAVTRLFSAPVFKWLADITYNIYLIHPLVMFCMWLVLPPSVWFAPDQPLTFALVSCLALALSIIATWAHNSVWSLVMRFLAP
ncbi:hypothetical protein WJX75_005734 [Coccomyxa subellipsoidea]|uniref:Acyltransferase 3 domain-containing protein n=1 Tax=Coccomyxa subellipsoidea TaxID=248742 RepID=A0ABR2YL08_9CHLO